ncbi:MAG: hypothetical protein HRT68_16360, partial [Flavobacteriaceae bacterium]|nr:hypothetical protein [Flavobacteriaceae bacterium]
SKLKNFKLPLAKHYGYIFIGGLLFFLFSSFRDKVEPHWIYFAVIPLILFSFLIISEEKILQKKITIGLSVIIFLIFGFRIIAMLPLDTSLEFHKEGKAFYSQLEELSQDKNVVFVNSYQKASKYQFYTKKNAYSSNNYFYRKNQYDLWDYTSFHNQSALVFSEYSSPKFEVLNKADSDEINYLEVDHFPVLKDLNASLVSLQKITNNQAYLEFSIHNPYRYDLDFSDTDMPLVMSISLYKNGERVGDGIIKELNTETIKAGEIKIIKGRFATSTVLDGSHEYGINIKPEGLYFIRISDLKKVTPN